MMKLRLKMMLFLMLTASLTMLSCQDDEGITRDAYILTSLSGDDINMNGIWSSGCVEANNNQILNESLSFNNEQLEIDIKVFDNLQCTGSAIVNEVISITFRTTGTTTISFDGRSVVVNTIDGMATYMDGNVEGFKQTFFVDDSGDEMFMHHALFENDGGQVNENGYPIELIPIAISRK